MPEALLLALPLVGGYLATISLYVTRYQVARDSGYRLYFRIVHYAIVLTGVALLIAQTVWFAASLIAAAIGWGWPTEPFPAGTWNQLWTEMLASALPHKWYIALLAFCLGHLTEYIVNTKRAKQDAIQKAIEDQDLELMIAKSQRETMPILFTLKGGKVYLGLAVKGPNPETVRRWVRILPIASGYRDATHMLRFNVGYAKILDKVRDGKLAEAPNARLEDFEVVLSAEEITGLHFFNVNVYRLFDPTGATLFEPPPPPVSPTTVSSPQPETH